MGSLAEFSGAATCVYVSARERSIYGKAEERELQSEIEQKVMSVLNGLEVVDLSEIGKSTNLYDAGMTSHASVKLMLALEDAFDIEFPDEMLQRELFSSISTISNSLSQILSYI